jgi:hypothetical protein
MGRFLPAFPMRPGRLALGAWLLALPLVAGAMPSQVATRTEKAVYLPAVNACKEAVALIESDPRTAVATLDPVLENPKIRKIECRLRIELRPSEYTTPYEFTPYRYRGRAHVELAARDSAGAVGHLQRAVADFKKSVEAGATESEPLQKEAEAALAKAKAAAAAAAATPPSAPDPTPAVPVDPVAAFKTQWQPLLDDGKFKSAMDLVAERGASLPAADRTKLQEQTRTESRKVAQDRLIRFRRGLDLVEQVSHLRDMMDFEVKSTFELAPPDELVDPPPAYAWARTVYPVFAEVQAGRATSAALLKVAAGAASLAEQGEPQWLGQVEPLAFEVLEQEVAKEVEAARDALRPEREAARKRADALLAGWRTLVGGLKPAVRSGTRIAEHEARMETLLKGFPVAPPELASADLASCFTAPDPDERLAELIRTFATLAAQNDPPVTKESRRELLARQVTATVLKALLAGKSEDEAGEAARSRAKALKDLQGTVDAKRYGPRVERVLKKLGLEE